MKTLKFDDRGAWLAARKGKITGTRLKDILVKRGTSEKKGFYELIAERIAVDPDGENPMDRGTRLEPEAIQRFIKETGKKVDTSLVLWTRDDEESIAISPDGIIGKTEAVEVKCLSSASHIEAWFTKEIPDEYRLQTRQYFITNDSLKKLYVVFFDPRIEVKDYFVFELNRKDLEEEIEELKAYQIQKLELIREKVNSLYE